MTAQLMPYFIQKFFDANGNALSGGKLFTYQAGTSTPLATYTDETAGTPNANPIVLDSSGQASVWLGSSAYKLILQDSLGNVIKTVDNVSYINLGSIDKTMISSNIAGQALLQNVSTKALDVQVDNVFVQVNGSNQLTLKPGAITADFLPASSKLEVLFKNTRDFSDPGSIKTIPQYEWASPALQGGPTLVGDAPSTKWSPNGEFLAVSSGSTPYILLYQRSGSNLTQLPNPAIIPTAAANHVAWSPCGDFLAVTTQATPYIIIYQRLGNSFVKLPDPASLPNGFSSVAGNNVAFSPNSDFLALSYRFQTSLGLPARGFIMYERGGALNVTGTTTGTTSTNIVLSNVGSSDNYVESVSSGSIAFPGTTTGTFSGAVTGTTFTDVTSAAGLPSGASWFAWSPDSSMFALLTTQIGSASTAINVYSRLDTTFTAITAPDTSTLTGGIEEFSFSPDGNYLAVISPTAPYLTIYSSPSFALLTSTPPTQPASQPFAPTWSANSEYLAVGLTSTPFLLVYSVASSSNTFTKIADLATLPVGPPLSIDWTQTKQYLALGIFGATPFFHLYKTASTLPGDSLLWSRGVPNV